MGEGMSRLRILLLAPFVDPDAVSMPYVAYAHAAALAELHDVTLVIGAPVEGNVRRAQGRFSSIEVVRTPSLERIYDWFLRKIFKYNFDTQVLTAFGYPFFLAFEWTAWRQLRKRIFAREFDVVLRLLPLTAVLPSPFAFLLRKGPIPFVIGPINGGLPWPQGFSQLENQKEWVSGLRNLYRYLPFSRSTYRDAAAIITASSQTYSEFVTYRDKLFFVPENGVSRSMVEGNPNNSKAHDNLELIFVGGLVPRKACDLALRAAAPLLREGLARFTVVGDGPERNRLEQLVTTLGIERAVLFCGWISHKEVLSRLRTSDVLVFPSLRDFGGGVVFEALALGTVPVVVDFGGPGDIIYPEVGYKVPLTNERDVIAEIEKALAELAGSQSLLERLQRQAITYARERLTWDAKAQDTTKILEWVLRRGPKPELLPPKLLATDLAALRTATSPYAKSPASG